MQTDITTLDAKKTGTVELSDHVFGLEPRPDILHRMVRYQLAKRRSGTRSVQDRSEVNYTGAKLYKQKGTGRARAGSFQSPLWVGGGVVFGPHPRSYEQRLPKPPSPSSRPRRTSTARPASSPAAARRSRLPSRPGRRAGSLPAGARDSTSPSRTRRPPSRWRSSSPGGPGSGSPRHGFPSRAAAAGAATLPPAGGHPACRPRAPPPAASGRGRSTASR